MAKAYPEEVQRYIRENYADTPHKELVQRIREQFGCAVSLQSVRCWASKHGINRFPDYTGEQEQWLVDHVDEYVNSIGLTDAFNKRFGTRKNDMNIKAKLHRLIPDHKYGWSGGKPQGEGSSVTAKPIGSETFKSGYWWIKVADNPLPKNYTGDQRRENWQQKHRVIYEKAYGPIPDGYLVVFLDGNRNNFDLDNLYCCPRQVQTVMMRNGWWTDNREHTLAAIKWCELFYALKEAEKKS